MRSKRRSMARKRFLPRSADERIRAFLEDETQPEDEKTAILQEQMVELQAMKTRENPDWQRVEQPAVEIRVCRDPISLARMVRRGRRGDD